MYNVNVAKCARNQSSIFSTGRKFCSDYGLLLELHALTLVARSYVLLVQIKTPMWFYSHDLGNQQRMCSIVSKRSQSPKFVYVYASCLLSNLLLTAYTRHIQPKLMIAIGTTVDRENFAVKIKHAKNKIMRQSTVNKLACKSTLHEVNVQLTTTASDPWLS